MADILCIDPAIIAAEEDCVAGLRGMTSLSISHHLPVLAGFSSLDKAPPPCGVILLGSKASPNDESAWQIELCRRLTTFIDQGVPMLGICYGHQILAKIFGGRVDFWSDFRKRSGLSKVKIFCEPRLNWQAAEGELFMSHREIVIAVPKNFNLLAQSAELSIEGLVHQTKPIWTLQAHPEATTKFCQDRYMAVAADSLRFGANFVKAFLGYCENNGRKNIPEIE